MATAGFNASEAVRGKLQAALYYARKQRLERVEAGRTFEFLFRGGKKGAWIDYAPGYVFSDTGLSVPVAPGEGIAGYVDRSPNGNDGTQPVITARPIFGRVPRTGRRNLLTWTEDFSNPFWLIERLYISAQGGGAFLVSEDTSTGGKRIRSGQIVVTEGKTYRLSIEVRRGAGDRNARFTSNNSNIINLNAEFDLSAGTVITGSGASIESIGDGWFRLSVVRDAAAGGTVYAYPVMLMDGVSFNYEGDGVSGLEYRHPDFRLASLAGPYQRVTNQYDITEEGVESIHYSHYDGADDQLPQDLPIPTIENGCFVLVGRNGIWIDNGWTNTRMVDDELVTLPLTVGPTTYTNGPGGILPVVGDVLTIIVRDEPLTEQERAKVVAAGIKRGSPGALVWSDEIVGDPYFQNPGYWTTSGDSVSVVVGKAVFTNTTSASDLVLRNGLLTEGSYYKCEVEVDSNDGVLTLTIGQGTNGNTRSLAGPGRHVRYVNYATAAALNRYRLSSNAVSEENPLNAEISYLSLKRLVLEGSE